jgi:Fe2+ transport system protein FeoA
MAGETLRERRPGDEVEVVEVVEAAQEGVAGRLLALGFSPQTRVRVLRRAPLGDPVEYALRGTRVSLRAAEAALVRVREVAP